MLRFVLPLVLLLTLTAAPPTAAQSHPDGAAVDALAYDFSIALPDSLDAIEGAADVTLRALRDVDSVALDLIARGSGIGLRNEMTAAEAGMAVESVVRGEKELAFTHDGDDLRVMLPEALAAGDSLTLRITYAGRPADGLILSRNQFGERTAFGDNWPERARHWLPSIDDPADKAAVAWRVTAPSGLQVVANGRLVEETDLGNGRRITRYAEPEAIPTYGMVIGVARFAVQHLREEDDVALESWVYPQDRAAGFYDLAVTRRVLDVFERMLGPYRFAKLAGVQSTTRYGGMENPGAIFYAEQAVSGTRSMEALIAHEVAHHWFGNGVTEAEWPHLWLSEGFATYLTDVYTERVYGRDAMARRLAAERRSVLGFSQQAPERPVIDTLAADPTELLNPNSYQKGAWVLHMLRRQVGDDAFFSGLRRLYDERFGGIALTDDVRRVMEDESGQALGTFFDQWLRRADEPAVEATWSPTEEGVHVRLHQTQRGEPFVLPVDVAVWVEGADGFPRRALTETVDMDSRSAEVTLPVEGDVVGVEVDPDTWLLAAITSRADK